ncbi:hypothetical protein ACUV84_014094 [Puccinellia chinampoensis]
MEPEPERQRFHTFFTIMRLIYAVILPGLGAYMSAVFLIYYIAQCGTLFHSGSGSGVPGKLAHLFSSPPFLTTLGLALITQICSTTLVVGVATLYRADALFHPRATPILAGLRTASGFFFYFKPVANLTSNIAFLRAFLLLDVPGEFALPLLLPAAAAYLVWSVCIAAACHAVPALQAARGVGFSATRWRLVLVAAGMFYVAAAVISLLNGFIIAGMMAFPSMVSSGMAMTAVLYTMVVVMFGAQPVVYLVFLKNFRP